MKHQITYENLKPITEPLGICRLVHNRDFEEFRIVLRPTSSPELYIKSRVADKKYRIGEIESFREESLSICDAAGFGECAAVSLTIVGRPDEFVTATVEAAYYGEREAKLSEGLKGIKLTEIA